jgi:hypothetical protein
MIESKDFTVDITIKFGAFVGFAPMERDSSITTLDAIANAVGHMPLEVWDQINTGFGGEFSVNSITFEVKEV